MRNGLLNLPYMECSAFYDFISLICYVYGANFDSVNIDNTASVRSNFSEFFITSNLRSSANLLILLFPICSFPQWSFIWGCSLQKASFFSLLSTLSSSQHSPYCMLNYSDLHAVIPQDSPVFMARSHQQSMLN